MKLITGNNLETGDVVWWTGQYWSRFVAEATDAGPDAERIAHREEAALRVNVPYVIDATPGPDGPVLLHIKERIRAAGPTVRPDLTIAPAEPYAGSLDI